MIIANSKIWLAFGCLLAGLGMARAQAYTPPPPPLVFGPCVPTKEFPCDPPQASSAKPTAPATANKFPFPGEEPGATAPTAASGASATKPSTGQQFPFPGESDGAPPADTPASGQKPADASKFPFPGETPEPAAPSGSSSSSSSSDDDANPPADPDKAGLKDTGSTGSTRFERKKLAVPEDLSKRELDDLDVSHYYITTGDYVGAYARAQDAVKLYPDDEQAHFALGLAADKMKKRDEAIREYQTYLKMAPDGPKAKQVEKALDLLGSR